MLKRTADNMPTNAKKKRKFSAIQTASSFSVSSFNASVNECKKRNVHIAFLCIDRGGGDDVPMSTTNCCCQPISSAPFFSFSFPLPLWSSSQTRPIHQVKKKKPQKHFRIWIALLFAVGLLTWQMWKCISFNIKRPVDDSIDLFH